MARESETGVCCSTKYKLTLSCYTVLHTLQHVATHCSSLQRSGCVAACWECVALCFRLIRCQVQYVCLCVCVCERERKSEREQKRERESEWVRERESVCVCVCVRVCVCVCEYACVCVCVCRREKQFCLVKGISLERVTWRVSLDARVTWRVPLWMREWRDVFHWMPSSVRRHASWLCACVCVCKCVR